MALLRNSDAGASSTGGGPVRKMQTVYVNGPRAGHREVKIAVITTRCPSSKYSAREFGRIQDETSISLVQ